MNIYKSATSTFIIRHMPQVPLKIRIGLHSGPGRFFNWSSVPGFIIQSDHWIIINRLRKSQSEIESNQKSHNSPPLEKPPKVIKTVFLSQSVSIKVDFGIKYG